MIENIGDVLRLIWRARLDHAAFGLDMHGFAEFRHAVGGLLQHATLFNRQMDLLWIDIRDDAAHRRGIDVKGTQNIFSGVDAERATNQLKAVVATVDFNAQTTLKLFDVVVERTAQAHQSAVICRFKGDFTSFDIQTNPLGHSGPVRMCADAGLINDGTLRNYLWHVAGAQASLTIFGQRVQKPRACRRKERRRHRRRR